MCSMYTALFNKIQLAIRIDGVPPVSFTANVNGYSSLFALKHVAVLFGSSNGDFSLVV